MENAAASLPGRVDDVEARIGGLTLFNWATSLRVVGETRVCGEGVVRRSLIEVASTSQRLVNRSNSGMS